MPLFLFEGGPMYFKCKNKKGFTLVEVLVSLVILGVIVASILSFFGTGLLNMFSIGSKDIAMSQASDIMDFLYRKQGSAGLTIAEIESNILDYITQNNLNGVSYSITGPNFLSEENDLESIMGYNVKISVTYEEDSEVTLTSFIRGRDNNG